MATVIPFITIPDMFMNLSKRYEGTEKVAFARKLGSNEPYQSIFWYSFTADVEALASFLMEEGVSHGDRVAILSENRYEWAVVDFAIQVLGLVNVSVYTTLPPKQCEYIIRDSGSSIFFVSTGIQLKKAIDIFKSCPELASVIAFDRPKNEKHLESDFVRLFDDVLEEGRTKANENRLQIRKMAKRVKPEDLCTLIYTSGTTGKPKGAMLTQNNIVSNVKSAHERLDLTESDRSLSFLPLSHSFERTAGYYAMLAAGTEIYFAESVDTVAKNLTEAKPTIVMCVPRLFERIYSLVMKSMNDGSAAKKRIFTWALKVGKRFADGKRGLTLAQYKLAENLVFNKLRERTGGNLRFFISGGAALPPEIGNFFRSSGLTILEGYGLTETSPVISVNPFGKERIGTVGHILNGVTVGIQRVDDGKILAEVSGESYPTEVSTEAGEIIVRGPNVMKGYWRQEEATNEVIDSEGWFHSGDIGKFDGGYLKITDRIKHMIVNAGGKNIYPGPIEDALKTNMLIEQAVVVGEKQSFMGALIVPDFEAIKSKAKEWGLKASREEDLIQEPKVLETFKKEIRVFSKDQASHEKIRDFRLLSQPFTVETGELTPTLKVKRRVIEEKYAEQIKSIFAKD